MQPFSFLNRVGLPPHEAKFVVVGVNSTAWSLDGDNWTVGTIPAGNWRKVNYANGIYMAVGVNCCAVSVDGKVFESVAIPTGPWTDCAFLPAHSRWIITRGISDSEVASTQYLTSDNNGQDFTARVFPASGRYPSLAYGNGQIVAVRFVTSGANNYTTTDGISWTASTNSPGLNWYVVSFVPSVGGDYDSVGSFVASGRVGNNRLFSRISSAAANARSSAGASGILAVQCAAGRQDAYFVVTQNAAQFALYDEPNLLAVASPQNSTWEDIAVHHGSTPNSDRFVAVSSNGANRIGRRNAYGAGWTALSIPAINTMTLNGVCYG